jgi:HPt (histidine-containing phosphotransfer) domain-containing protein
VLDLGEVLDKRRLEQLFVIEQRGAPGYVASLCAAFLSDAPHRLQRLQAALTCGDAARLQDEAHALRSSAATVGALLVARCCAALEEASKAGDTAELGALLQALTQQLARAEPLLARLSRTNAPG